MPTYATPGVYFESVDQAAQGIAAIRTDIAAFVGIAQKGQLHEALPVNSWEQFQGTFGTFLPNGYLAYAAKAFFENGGQRLYGVRVAAPHASAKSTGGQPADGMSSVVDSVEGFVAGAVAAAQQSSSTNTSGPQPADRWSSIVNSVAGFSQGSVVHISQTLPPFQTWHRVQGVDAVAKRLYWDSPLEPQFSLAATLALSASHHADFLITAVNSTTLTLSWSSSLLPVFDLTQPIEFGTGATQSAGVLFDALGKETLEISAASPGTWGDQLAVSVSRTSLAATTTLSAAQPPAGDSSFVQSVVGFQPYSLVRVYQTQSPTPVVAYRMVTSVNPATKLLKWDAVLGAAFDLTKPISFETVEFALTVYENGSAKENFPGLSLNPKHARYVETVVNPPDPAKPAKLQTGMPSQLICVKDVSSSSPAPDNLPDPSSLRFSYGVLYLSGGGDGIAALTALHFAGDGATGKKWGIRAMEDVDEISIVAAPDILIEPVPPLLHSPVPSKPPNPCLPCSVAPTVAPVPAPVPTEATPSFTLEDIFYVQQALIEHCRFMQFRLAVLDPPDFGYPRLRVDLGEIQSWRNRFDTMYAALYYPWVFVRDPLQLANQVVRRIPPSGHVAGVYANTDLTAGVFRAPANAVVQWGQDLTNAVSPETQGFLNPIAVNCLRNFPGRGMRVYGARTLSSDSTWRYVNVRRLLFMIEHTLEISMQWVVFEPNNVHLWHLLRVSIESFLTTLWKRGALAGNTAEESFYVKCDSTNNPTALTAEGQLHVEVGVAPALPAEFVVFRLGRTEDTLEVSE